jgi:hypothetical protein
MKCNYAWMQHIAPLKHPRGGYVNITIKWFYRHLHTKIAKLMNKQKALMKREIEMEWDHTQDIDKYFTRMEDKQMNWNDGE